MRWWEAETDEVFEAAKDGFLCLVHERIEIIRVRAAQVVCCQCCQADFFLQARPVGYGSPSLPVVPIGSFAG